MNTFPKRVADTLRLFRFYHDDTGLPGLINSLDLSNVTPRQIYFAVHGRPPDTIEEATADTQYPIPNIFEAFLQSDEFRSKLVSNVLAAVPEKQRLLFVHIPKCAGSNLSTHLTSKYASLKANVMDPDVTSQAEFFRAIKDVMLETTVSDAIFVHGHVHLQTYEDWGALRVDDQVFTVLRDPVEVIVSQVNYVITRMLSDEVPAAPDTIGWQQEFGFTPNSKPTHSELRALASRILLNRGVVPENVISQFLGNGQADLATERLVTRNVEVTTMPRYDAWCTERWNIVNPTRRNSSEHYFNWSDFSMSDRDLVLELTQDDRKIYDWAETRLQEANALSLTGRALLPLKPVGTQRASAGPSDDDGLELMDLMSRFESLGENCEFGLVQRRCKAELLGLLRWASAPYDKLLRAVQAGFAGLGAPESLRVELSTNGREYMVNDLCYGLYSHSWLLKNEATPDEVLAAEARRIPFLRRKLLEDLALGEKLFVYHGMSPLTEQQAWDLSNALRVLGPATLFWIELADEWHPNGTVEKWGDGLLKGYIDRFAPGENAQDFALESWIELCRKAEHVRASRH